MTMIIKQTKAAKQQADAFIAAFTLKAHKDSNGHLALGMTKWQVMGYCDRLVEMMGFDMNSRETVVAAHAVCKYFGIETRNVNI